MALHIDWDECAAFDWASRIRFESVSVVAQDRVLLLVADEDGRVASVEGSAADVTDWLCRHASTRQVQRFLSCLFAGSVALEK